MRDDDRTAIRCRACAATAGAVVLDLGEQPQWDRMPPRDSPLPDRTYPLRMWLCAICGLAQLEPGAEEPDAVEELRTVEPAAVAEQSDLSVGSLVAEGAVRAGGRVVEYGSPHGESWLPRLAAHGMTPVAPDTCPDGTADLVVDYYGLLHEPDQQGALARRATALAPGGTLALQLLPLGTVLREGQWYDLRHGHHAYWSLPALRAALHRFGLGLHRARRYPLSGGTVLVTARAGAEPDATARDLVDEEHRIGVTDPARLGRLQDAADGAGLLRDWLLGERAAGRTVAGYGAASRAVPLVCRTGASSELMVAVGDAAPVKQGRRMPGTDVPIVSPDELADLAPDRVVIFLPELAEEMRDRLPGIEDAGGRWVVLTPGPHEVPPRSPLAGAGRPPHG